MYTWHEQAIIEWSCRMISIVACCHSVKFCALAAWVFTRNTRYIRYILVIGMTNNLKWREMNMYLVLDLNLATFQYTGGFGFNHFCLTRIGIDDTLLNFFVAFGAVLGVQVTLFIRVSQICWDCLFNVFKCWALSVTSETSLLHVLSFKLTELIGYSLIQSLFLSPHCYTLRIRLEQFIIFYMCSPVPKSRLCCILLVFWFDIVHAIAEHGASQSIADNSEYFEISVFSVFMMLWGDGRKEVNLIYFLNYLQYSFVFELDHIWVLQPHIGLCITLSQPKRESNGQPSP